ncbi:MAG TPA: nucleotide exchange factor GrpE [Candidatus Limnocylindrales bacterium]|nr:nucleotide exchange factor GrpE [Candidatus Limnocylindrales bacterium]
MDPIDPFRRRPPRPHIHATPHRTRADERADALDISPAKLAAEVERLTRERDAALRKARGAEAASAEAAKGADRAELEAAMKARDEYLAALQRERAEFLNFKRRTAEEREASLGLAAEGLIRKVLALADDFDLAIDSRPESHADDPWVEGIAAIDRKLRQLLESEGVTPIDATRGMTFDPRDHEAVATLPGTGLPEGQVVEELRRGYRLRDRVIRPALVAVSEGASDHDTTRPTEPRVN